MKLSNPVIVAMLAGALALPAAADSGRKNRPLDPAYVEDCGSCHVAFPPRALGAASWQTLMDELPRHFGVDASLEPAVAESLLRYLKDNARHKDTLDGAGRPEIRITEATWFVREHDEVGEGVWKRPAVKSPTNCAACHQGAERGNYAEHALSIPR